MKAGGPDVTVHAVPPPLGAFRQRLPIKSMQSKYPGQRAGDDDPAIGKMPVMAIAACPVCDTSTDRWDDVDFADEKDASVNDAA